MKTYKDTENKIIGHLLRNPIESKSLNKIAVETNLSYVTVHKIVPILIKRKILKQEKNGRSSLISIDFENARIEDLSSAILSQKTYLIKKYPKIGILIEDIEKILSENLYVLVLFGSYAKGEAKKDSDVDFLFIINNCGDKEEYKEKIKKAIRLTTLKVDFNVFSMKDFNNMLNEKYSVGREVFNHGIVLFGTDAYYVMVKEYARKRGY